MIEHLKYLWRRCHYCSRRRGLCMWLPCTNRTAKELHVFGDGRKWTGREDRIINDTIGRQWEFVSKTGTSIAIRDLPMRPFDESTAAVGDYLIIPTMAGNFVFKCVD